MDIKGVGYNRDVTAVDRAIVMAVVGLFLALALLAIGGPVEPEPPATPTTQGSSAATVAPPAGFVQIRFPPVAAPLSSSTQSVASSSNVVADAQEAFRLRRTAIDARRAYMTARSTEPRIQALEKEVRKLVDDTNEMLTRARLMLCETPNLARLSAPDSDRKNASTNSVALSSVERDYLTLQNRIDDNKTKIKQLVDQQNAIADADASLVALRAAERRAFEACASNELVHARSPINASFRNSNAGRQP